MSSVFWGKTNILIHDIADWLEAIGFIVTIVTAIKVFLLNTEVKKLRDKHLFQNRVNEHLKDLKQSSKKISEYISNFQENYINVKVEISTCVEHCNSIRKKVDKNALENLPPLIRRLKKLQRNNLDINSTPTGIQKALNRRPITGKDVEDIYIMLNSLITEIEHFTSDQKKILK